MVIALNLLLGLGYSFVVPFMSLFGTKEVGMSPMLYGVFMTVNTVAAIFFGTALAHYSDVRYSRRSMLLLGSVCGALGYIGFAFLRDFRALVLVGSLLLGVSSISFSQVFALAREYLNSSNLPKTEGAFFMNAFRMFFALSWTVGPAMAAWMMKVASYPGLFIAAAGCFAGLFLVVWKCVPGGIHGGAAAQTKTGESVYRVLRRWDVLAHFLGFVLVLACGTIGMMNLPLFVTENLHGDAHHIGIIYSVAPVFELPFMLYFGMLATRIDTAKVIRIGIVIAVLYYALLSLVQAPWNVYPLQVLSAAMVAVTSGVAITYFQNYLPHHAGSATNLYSTAQRMGSLLGYLLWGAIGAHGYRTVFYVCTALAVASLLLLFVPGKPDTAEAAAPAAA